MTINVIVAVSDNGVIGKDGKIPWRLPSDMKRFKGITEGHHIVMGSKTFRSIGAALPYRDNWVITRNENLAEEWEIEGFLDPESGGRYDETGYFCGPHFSSWNDLLWREKVHIENKDYFIIGGQQIYDEIFKTPELIHRVYLTRVHYEVEGGDAFFNYGFPFSKRSDRISEGIIALPVSGIEQLIPWRLVQQERVPKSDTDEYDSTFQIWENRNGQ